MSNKHYDNDSLPEVETVTIEAARGPDGFIGFQILSHPTENLHNIVVVVEEGSAAERDGLFRLGDVIVEADGLEVDGVDMISAGALSVAKKTHHFTVRRFKSEGDRRASLEATTPLDPSEVATIRPSSQPAAPFRLNLSTTRATADPFQLTASTPRDVVFAQAAALQQKYSARAAAEVTAMTPRTKGTHSGALMRAKTAKSRRVSGGAMLAVLAH